MTIAKQKFFAVHNGIQTILIYHSEKVNFQFQLIKKLLVPQNNDEGK